MPINRESTLLAVAAAAFASASPKFLSAQERTLGPRPAWADSTPVRIMSRPNGFPSADVVEVLRQRHQKYSDSKRRELAELVVDRAITDPRHGTAAVEAIVVAGASDPGLGGIPDPNALDLLVRIQKAAKGGDERHLALIRLIDQVNPTRALPYLRQIAMSSNEDNAYWAVVQIGRLAFGLNTSRAIPSERAEAERLLRELYDQNLVKGRGAGLLCDAAVTHKWPSARRCAGSA